MSDDPNVRAAIAHWAPRFIANGIDYNDFVATTARVERWRDWSAGMVEDRGKHEALAREADEQGAARSRRPRPMCAPRSATISESSSTSTIWSNIAAPATRRSRITARRSPAWIRRPSGSPSLMRDRLPGYLRVPAASARPPVVLIVCGLDSVKEEMNAFEPLFHRRGMATLTFDGPGQGESEALPIEPHFEKVVAAALDWLASTATMSTARGSRRSASASAAIM